MQDRLDAVGGSLQVTSAPGSGTDRHRGRADLTDMTERAAR